MLNNMKVLIGLLILIAGLAYWVSVSQNQLVTTYQPLIPAWQQGDEPINAIDQVSLTKGSEQLVLTKNSDNWLINGGFYAAIEPLFDLMQALKSAEIIEAKTANPEKHAQLELAEGDLKVSLFQDGALKHAFYIGKQSTAGLTFVRLVDEDQTYTVKGLAPISFDADKWSLKTVVDVAAEAVNEVTIKPAQGDTIKVIRNTENAALQLADMPNGFKLKPNAYLDQLVGGLSRLMIDEALPAESSPLATAEGETVPLLLSANYLLASGETVNLAVYQQGESYLMTIDSDLYPQYDGWVMKIASYKFNALNRELTEFIEPVGTEDKSLDDTSVESSGD